MAIDMSETFALHLFMSFPQLYGEKGKPVSLNLFKNTIIMESFDFYLDTKVTMWRREKFSIEAETINDACTIAMETAKAGDVCMYNSDIEDLIDTCDVLDTKNNGGNATEELFADTPIGTMLLWDNRLQEIDINNINNIQL